MQNCEDLRPYRFCCARNPRRKDCVSRYMQGKDRVGRRDSITNRKKVEQVGNNLPDQVKVPRSLAVAGEEIREITFHAFGDASGQGLAAAVYVQQHSAVTQGLVTAKARLAKEGLTISRLELVAGHMAANLLTNVRDALIGFPVKSLYAWLDSSVALHWIRGCREYKQFVSNQRENWTHMEAYTEPRKPFRLSK